MARAPMVAPRVAVPARSAQPAAARIAVSGHAVMRAGTVRTRTGNMVIRTPHRPAPPRVNPRVNPIFNNNVFAQDEFGPEFFGVPGLGFDFPHLAAIQGARGRFHHRFGMSFPLFGGGFFIPTAPVFEEEVPATTDQQEAAAPQETTQPETVQTMRRPRVQEPVQSFVEVAPSPLREADEYVFVRRNGTLIFAVAYAWQNGTLQYVTKEGLRRSVAGEALDLNATQQFNEQRGLTFRLPA